MKIGIFGGSFDPVHLGHINAIEEVKYALNFDKIIVVPAFLSPHKVSTSLNMSTRLECVRLALKDYSNVEISDYEIKQETQVYTFDTLKYFQALYPDDDITLVIGTDQYLNFSKWYKYQSILDSFNVVVVNRYHDGIEIEPPFQSVNTPVFELSSTLIRQRMKDHAPFKHLVPREVYTYLKENNKYGRDESFRNSTPQTSKKTIRTQPEGGRNSCRNG